MPAFQSTVQCPTCHRQYALGGIAPLGTGHRPHYATCECGRKMMAIVPAGAKVERVEPHNLDADLDGKCLERIVHESRQRAARKRADLVRTLAPAAKLPDPAL